MMGGMEQLRPMMQVILHDRNEVVAKDLKNIIATEPNVKSIAAFYGAAHLPDLEATLVKDLNLKLVNETWTPAITVDLKKAGASFAEVKQMRAMIQRQMRGK
jgi:pheromone shutdown protein TraB